MRRASWQADPREAVVIWKKTWRTRSRKSERKVGGLLPLLSIGRTSSNLKGRAERKEEASRAPRTCWRWQTTTDLCRRQCYRSSDHSSWQWGDNKAVVLATLSHSTCTFRFALFFFCTTHPEQDTSRTNCSSSLFHYSWQAWFYDFGENGDLKPLGMCSAARLILSSFVPEY